jgi:broad specificity phosphatase PhoE
MRLRLGWAALAILGPTATLDRPLAPEPAAVSPITVFLVRHAEKSTDDPRDPTLSEAGRRRAGELARVLSDGDVTALFATEYRRTQETLAPLAARIGVPTTIIGAGRPDSLVARLRALPPGSRAVVASHSNLVPAIVARLAGVEVTPLTDADYDRLYVVTLAGNGVATAVVLRYGEP